jgi:hypothetical protein
VTNQLRRLPLRIVRQLALINNAWNREATSSMSAQQIFTSAIAVAASALKQRGFPRGGSKFTRMGGEVVSLIEFQRSL